MKQESAPPVPLTVVRLYWYTCMLTSCISRPRAIAKRSITLPCMEYINTNRHLLPLLHIHHEQIGATDWGHKPLEEGLRTMVDDMRTLYKNDPPPQPWFFVTDFDTVIFMAIAKV